MMSELSIIIPCYNEENNLINLVNEFVKKKNKKLRFDSMDF